MLLGLCILLYLYEPNRGGFLMATGRRSPWAWAQLREGLIPSTAARRAVLRKGAVTYAGKQPVQPTSVFILSALSAFSVPLSNYRLLILQRAWKILSNRKRKNVDSFLVGSAQETPPNTNCFLFGIKQRQRDSQLRQIKWSDASPIP